MKSFQQTQLTLASHLRDPEQNPGPAGIEDRRLGIYRDLIYNNIEGFISASFPVLRSLISEQNWQAMVRDFLIKHRAQTPYFLAISQEFLHYLMSERQAQPDDYPFMLQLAHYEWVELAVDIAEADLPAAVAANNLVESYPRVSPLVMNLSYDYPVHKISRAFIPARTEPCYLLVYRTDEDQVKFMEANALTHRLVFLLQQQPECNLQQIVDQLVLELQHPQPEVFLHQALALVEKLFSERIISHFEQA